MHLGVTTAIIHTLLHAKNIFKTRNVDEDQGPDFRRVVMLKNGAVRTKQNLSTAHEFVVC